MINVGTWKENKKQLHRFFSLKDVTIKKGPNYSISAKDCYASETHLKGKVEVNNAQDHKEYMCDNGTIEFDLKIKKIIPFNVGYGTSWLFRTIKAFEMYWHAEGMKSEYEGTIILDGKKYNVIPNKSYGYADKNWGRNFTSPWVWLSSNNMISNITNKKLNNSVFDIGGGRPKIYFIPLERKLLGAFYYEGKCYEYNFSKFWNKVKTVFDCKETQDEIVWYIRQENRKTVMETNVRCYKKDMLLINYEAPDGSKRHNRLWNGGNGIGNIKLYKKVKNKLELIDDIQVYNIGCEYGEYD